MEVVSTSTSRLNDSPSYCLIGNRASPGVITQNYFEKLFLIKLKKSISYIHDVTPTWIDIVLRTENYSYTTCEVNLKRRLSPLRLIISR